jgi:hypothetical protein
MAIAPNQALAVQTQTSDTIQSEKSKSRRTANGTKSYCEWSASPQSRDRSSLCGGTGKWAFLGQKDSSCLREAAQGLTFVAYDRRTIPPLLKTWAEEERTLSGVVCVHKKRQFRPRISAVWFGPCPCDESLTGVAKLGRIVFLFHRRQQGVSLQNQVGRLLIL